MSKRMKNALDRLLPDFKVHDCDERGGCYEIESWSPEGEDVIITLRGATLAQLAADAREAWECFDAEEHAAEILVAKRTGTAEQQRYYAGAPDGLRDLLADAEEIKSMHGLVFEKLITAARAA